MRSIAVALALVVVLAGTAWAQSSGGSFRVSRHTVAGGGGRSSGGSFIVHGTAGQFDAGTGSATSSQGGAFRVRGGFWPTSPPPPDELFVDGFESP